ncbi:MAG: septum formation initiator family protein [Actinomycetota bacterium]
MSATEEQIPSQASSAPHPALSLIRRRSRSLIKRGSNTRFAPFAVFAAICVAALVSAVLLEQVILAQSAFKLASVRRDIIAAESRNQGLLLEMTKLQSPARIERFARARLGMVDRTDVEYIVADVGSRDGRSVALLRPSAKLGRAGPAAALGTQETP